MDTLILASVTQAGKSPLTVIPAWVWTFFSAVLLFLTSKVIEKLLKYRSDERDDRKEYREEISELRDRIDALEQQITLTRERYYAEQVKSQRLYLTLIRNNITPDPGIMGPDFDLTRGPTHPETDGQDSQESA